MMNIQKFHDDHSSVAVVQIHIYLIRPPSSVSTLLLVLGPLGRATAAPVPVAFIVPLFPMFDPGLAVLVVPVSGARS